MLQLLLRVQPPLSTMRAASVRALDLGRAPAARGWEGFIAINSANLQWANIERTSVSLRILGCVSVAVGLLLIISSYWALVTIGVLSIFLGCISVRSSFLRTTRWALVHYRALLVFLPLAGAILMLAQLIGNNNLLNSLPGVVFVSFLLPITGCGLCAFVARKHLSNCRDRDLFLLNRWMQPDEPRDRAAAAALVVSSRGRAHAEQMGPPMPMPMPNAPAHAGSVAGTPTWGATSAHGSYYSSGHAPLSLAASSDGTGFVHSDRLSNPTANPAVSVGPNPNPYLRDPGPDSSAFVAASLWRPAPDGPSPWVSGSHPAFHSFAQTPFSVNPYLQPPHSAGSELSSLPPRSSLPTRPSALGYESSASAPSPGAPTDAAHQRTFQTSHLSDSTHHSGSVDHLEAPNVSPPHSHHHRQSHFFPSPSPSPSPVATPDALASTPSRQPPPHESAASQGPVLVLPLGAPQPQTSLSAVTAVGVSVGAAGSSVVAVTSASDSAAASSPANPSNPNPAVGVNAHRRAPLSVFIGRPQLLK